ncbi:AAA family ATPase, partial [Streptomyces sp. NPDC094049]|uniref:AAA family ATPase n=1 Tax=Streptomyces sp. NPDC094049 TaxID=3154987 RepID=UPI003322A267
ARLLAEAARTGTKLIAIGDPLQLQAVGVGGWYAEVHRLVEGEVLTENRRQEDQAERAALEIWRTGDHQAALDLLAAGGRVHAAETAAEARSQMLMVWQELRAAWPDELDLLEHLVVLAARNLDVDALNLGAQQVRRALGELGTEHTYALPGGAELTLAEGDIVRIRANDYRSRRGAGPDILNGFRGVITAIGEDRSVEVTWRTAQRLPDGSRATESAWMSPADIAAGTLSLGYAMTVAASQGLTCDTSLLYGHGANAFAAYPGLTRGRTANHLWLPLDVVEDERTRQELGAARTEIERLHRAVQAFARYLGQSRPDTLVSDELRPAPEPAARVPHQVETDQARQDAEAAVEQARRRVVSARAARMRSTTTPNTLRRDAETESARQTRHTGEEPQEPPSWKDRPYGTQTDAQLAATIRSCHREVRQHDQVAAKTRQDYEALRTRLEAESAEGLTRGERWAAQARTILDTAVGQLATAIEEEGRARWADTEARQARAVLPALDRQMETSWLALRLAGNSRKEVRELRARYLAQAVEGEDEWTRARRASDEARLAAWRTVKDSPRARTLGATAAAPPLDELPQALAAMRDRISQTAQHMDTRDQTTLGRLAGDIRT